MTDPAWAIGQRAAAAVGGRLGDVAPLRGGSTGTILRIALTDGRLLVAKAGGDRTVEARMLRDLAAGTTLPLPMLRHADPDLLVLDHVAHERGRFDDAVQRDLARHLAALHQDTGAECGYGYDTPYGTVVQDNRPAGDWIGFFRERRLIPVTAAARNAGRLEPCLARRLDRLSAGLDRFLTPPTRPALLHGDLWTGNLLHRGGRVVAFLDPALFFGHPEYDLACGTLFANLRPAFFDAYGECLPFDRPGFFDRRREIYLLYPLLAHVLSWDTRYAGQVDRILTRLGF